MNSRKTRLGLLGVALLFVGSTVLAQVAQDSGWFTVDGGGGQSSGGAFTVRGTIGQPDAGGTLSGGSYTLAGGFWGGGVQPAPPTIASVAPAQGGDGEDVTITISGGGFVATPRVVLGATTLESVTFQNRSSLRAVVPAGFAPGLYNLTVVNPGGLSATATGAYRVTAALAPIPRAIAPNRGLNDRDTAIVITGENFSSRATARLGATPLRQVVFVDPTRIEAVVPAGIAPGLYALSVVNPGNRVGTLAGAFTVSFPPPQIGSIVPRQGRNDRVTTIVINGTGFRATPRVDLGGQALRNVRFNDTTQVEATVPARLDEGTYPLRLINPDGQQATLANAFSVTALPPPPSHDLAFAEWEITQGIQNLANNVPLVADKPTYVRVYGRNLAGVAANAVTVALEGTRGGAPLPGSPLVPINYARSLNVGQGFDRSVMGDSWTFRLPPEWTRAGNLSLRATLDPNQRLNDPNRLNNSRGAIFSFTRKAPICGVFIRVRTHSPLPSFSSQSAQNAVAAARQMLPVADFWTYTQGMVIEEWEPGIAPWDWGDYGPYEADDKEWILLKLKARDTFSDDPDECDDTDGRTHYIGMVHTDFNFDVNGSANGGGDPFSFIYGTDQLVFRMPPEIPWDQVTLTTARIATLPHELGHNYQRKHVNCPAGSAEGVDNSYPYPACDIAPNDPAGYYGFFAGRWQPITPMGAGDMMSYAHQQNKARWPSDYTWRAIFGGVSNRGAGLAVEEQGAPVLELPPGVAAARREVANASEILVISGVITPALGQAVLQSGWNLPAASLSPGVRAKLVRVAAPAPGEQDLEYRLRLLDASGRVLAERLVPLLDDDEEPAPPGQNPQQNPPPERVSFLISLPDPGAPVARVELARASSVLAAAMPGTSAPVVSMITPAAGQRVAGRLEVIWNAFDPDANDRLRFTLQYSPDGGASWRSFAEDIAADVGTSPFSFTLDNLAGLAGGAQAMVRVIASDGYNTTIATSAPFTMAAQAPESFIVSPGAGQRFAAGEPVVLRGGAVDAEDGPLDAARLRWQVDGRDAGLGAELLLAGLAPGEHQATLRGTDTAGQAGTARRAFTVAPLSVPLGGAVGRRLCDDPAYAGAARVQLAPIPGGLPAQAALIRTAAGLWVCLDDLPLAGGAAPDTVALLIDANNSRGALAQAGDYRVVVDSQGVARLLAGDGKGGYAEAGGAPIQARVGGDDAYWSAELQIPFARLPGLAPVIGLALELQRQGAPPARYAWPHAAAAARPDSWATTLLGTQPAVAGLAPASALAGGPAFTLAVSGTGFVSGSVVRWNGANRPTTYVSENLLRAQIGAADLAAAGQASVTVVNPGLAGAPSAPAAFVVANPPPAIGAARLDTSSGRGVKRTLIVQGSGFAPGATLYWEGSARPTTVAGANLIRAEVDLASLVGGDRVTLTVYNPGPGGGLSNLFVLPLTGEALPPEDGTVQYVPLVRR